MSDTERKTPFRDWKVRCPCGAEYTPKARQRPESCYECGSENIHVDPLQKANERYVGAEANQESED